MKKTLFMIALLTFLGASIFFILLALGYNYDFSKNKFERTSTLYLKSYPRGANIFLNDERYKENTPTEITHLKSDLYDIEVKKGEYQSWKKQFLIKPEETIFIEDISLFYNNPQISILKNGNLEELSISPNKENLLFYDVENKSLHLFSITENRIINLEQNLDNIDNSLWSSDNQKILLQDEANYYISFVYFNNPLLNLRDYINFNPKEIVWDKFDSNLLYIINNRNLLFSFNIDNKELKLIDIDNVITVKPEGDKLFYVRTDKEGRDGFYLFNLRENNKFKILDLGYNLNYKFLKPYNDYFCLLDSNQNLYLMDPNEEDYLIKKFYNIKDLEWDLYNRILLLRNDFEVWSYDLVKDEDILINRFSSEIANAFWHRNNNHIFYMLQDSLSVVELDFRDKRNFYNLDNIYNADLFLSNRRGNILYYISPSGLTKSIIQ